MLDVKIDERYGIPVVVRLDGTITIGRGDQILRRAIDEVFASGKARMLLHIEKVSMVDPSGMGELIRSYRWAGERGGVIKLLRVSVPILELFRANKLVTVFEIHDSEDVAVRSFR